jgi:hypothetical protein
MGNVEAVVPLVKRNEVQQIVGQMAVDGNLEGGPKNLTDCSICVKYFPRAPGMGVAVCSVCGLAIEVAFYQNPHGGYVHKKCIEDGDSDSSGEKVVRPRNADNREFLHERFFGLLLSNMPTRPLKDGQECIDCEFQDVYAKTWQSALGPTPSLRELQEYAYTFLTGKCDPTGVEAAITNPAVPSNEFKWPEIKDTECGRIVQKTVGDYGLGLLWGKQKKTRDIKPLPGI